MLLLAAVDQSQSIPSKGREWQSRSVQAIEGALAPEDELKVIHFAGKISGRRRPWGER